MSNTNRNKVLLGFSAVVAVLIVAILLWPSNFRREDASGAIGAVQKHRAPQITPKDVVLGNEAVKHQQKVLYADFLADAGKLRAIGARQDMAAAREFGSELNHRYLAAAEEALAYARTASRGEAASHIEALDAMIANKARLSNEEERNFYNKLAMLADEEKAASRIKNAEAIFSQVNLADEMAARKLKEAEGLMSRDFNQVSLADRVDALKAMNAESSALAEAESGNLAMKLSEAEGVAEAAARAGLKALYDEQIEITARLKALNETAEQASRTAGKSQLGMMNSRSPQYNALNAAVLAVRNAQVRYEAQLVSNLNDEVMEARRLKDGESLSNQLMNLQSNLAARSQ